MEYRTLSSLFYQNKDDYKNEYEKRIHSHDAIYFPININGHHSFLVPNWEMISLVESIGKNNTVAYAFFSKLPGVAQIYYIRKCLIDEIQTTNDIEGVNSTRKEITFALNAKESTSKLARFQGMAKKYEKLLQDETYDMPFSTCADIRSLYDELVSNEIADSEQPDGMLFRKNTVFVVTKTQQIKHEGVNPEQEIIRLLEYALSILENNQLPILVRIATFHYFFGYIHPFYDGNGRISRFISSYLLRKNGFLLSALDFSHTIKDNRKKYYTAFQKCNDKRNKGDVTPFVLMFLEFLNIASERMSENLFEGLKRLDHFEQTIKESLFIGDKLRDKKSTILSLFIQNGLFAAEPFLISELCKHMSCSRSTLEKLLNSLINDGYPIFKIKDGKYLRYGIEINKFEEMIDNL